MQTFLPYPDVAKSMQALDYRRLGKQRIEAGQLITAIRARGGGWFNHPAAQMWLRYVDFLEFYRAMAIAEWVSRGYRNTLVPNSPFQDESVVPPGLKPWWYGDPAFHMSHQSNLIRKDPAFYSAKFPDVSHFLPYVWPSAYPP